MGPEGKRKVAMVIGATGVTGAPLVEQLALAGWKVYAVSRRVPQLRGGPHAQFHHLSVDLTDRAAAHAALAGCADVTHVFHCAFDARSEMKLAMLGNTLDIIEAMAPGFANMNLLQGTKYYGSDLGPFKTPAKETDPRVPGGQFYYFEEDFVIERQRGKHWGWTGVRPTAAVCGYAAGNPVNLATVLAIYGSLLRELGQPFGFPGSAACFNSLIQATDAELLARASIWVSTIQGCRNKAFNVNNGDLFRWKYLWPALAEFFGLEPAGPQPCSLTEFLADKQPLWQSMTRKYGLRPFPFERTPGWVQGSFASPNSRLGCEYDFIADTLRIRQSGFSECIDSEQMFLRLFAQFRADKLIP